MTFSDNKACFRQLFNSFFTIRIRIYIPRPNYFRKNLGKQKTEVSAESGKVKEIRASANFCLHSCLKPRPFGFFRLSGAPLYDRRAMKISCFYYLTVQTINNFKLCCHWLKYLQNEEISEGLPEFSRWKIQSGPSIFLLLLTFFKNVFFIKIEFLTFKIYWSGLECAISTIALYDSKLESWKGARCSWLSLRFFSQTRETWFIQFGLTSLKKASKAHLTLPTILFDF